MNLTSSSDINECDDPSRNNCEQTCLNKDGSFECACQRGYVLNDDKQTCSGNFVLDTLTYKKINEIYFRSYSLLIASSRLFLSYCKNCKRQTACLYQHFTHTSLIPIALLFK